MPTYEITSPDGQTYEVTAPEGADEGAVMAYAQEQFAAQPESAPEDIGMMGRIGEDIEKRAQDVGEIQQWGNEGKISKPAEVLMMAGKGGAGLVGDIGGELVEGAVGLAQQADEATGGYIGTGLSRVGGAISSMPSIGGGTIGEKIPQEIEQISQQYGEFAQENPITATGLEAGANMLMLAPAAKYGEDILNASGRLVKKSTNKEMKKLTSGEARKKGALLFQAAEKEGGGVSEQFWKEYMDDVVKSVQNEPEIVKALHGGDSTVHKAIERLNELDLQGQSYSTLKEMHTALGNYAEAARDMGAATPESRIYESMKHALVDKLENAPDDLFVGGKKAFELSKEGRKYYAASFRLDEIERVIQRAEGAAQPSTVMKNGFRKIRDNKKLFGKYSQKEQGAILKAAKTGLMEDMLKGFSSNLMPMLVATGMGASGGAMVGGAGGAALGIAGASALRQGAKGTVEAMQLGKANRVQNAIRQGINQQQNQGRIKALGDLSTAAGRTTRPIAAMNAITQETQSQRAARLYGEKKP